MQTIMERWAAVKAAIAAELERVFASALEAKALIKERTGQDLKEFPIPVRVHYSSKPNSEGVNWKVLAEPSACGPEFSRPVMTEAGRSAGMGWFAGKNNSPIGESHWDDGLSQYEEALTKLRAITTWSIIAQWQQRQ